MACASNCARGAYGIRIVGVAAAQTMLGDARPEWPRLRLVSEFANPRAVEESVTDGRAVLRLKTGGRLTLDRQGGVACYAVPRFLTDEELVHPFLAPAAAIVSHWAGRLSFHAGAFVSDGAVWAVVGDREAGKSSTLAWLALRGHPVVCDDMLILDGTAAFAGPRSIDLRPEAARQLGVGEPMGVVGTRERWRLRVGPVDSGMPMRGWIFLAWGPRLEIERLPGSRRIALLAAQRGVRLPPLDAASLLELAALPAWELRRPQAWDSVSDAAERLLENITG
jgi:hypothetical protein